MFSHGHHNHPPCCIIHRSSIDSSRARQGENKVSFSESRLAAAALKKSQARLSSAVNWYNCSEETELWQHCGSMAYHLMSYKTNVSSTITVREQLVLWVELFGYGWNLKHFAFWLIYFLTSKYAAFSLKCCSTQWQSWRIQLHCVCIAAL